MNDATNANPSGDRPNPWLDAEEVAPLLCTTAHTLRRLARQGRCPVVVRRIGGRWRFSRRSVDDFVHGTDTQEAS